MSVDTVRKICRALPAVTEDIKWGSELRRELEELIKSSYELVVAGLPRSKRPDATRPALKKRRS